MAASVACWRGIVERLTAPHHGVEGKLTRTPGRYAFQAKYGRLFQIEIDALPPDVLQTMVLDAIEDHFDRETYESILEDESAEHALLAELGAQWDAMRNGDGEAS